MRFLYSMIVIVLLGLSGKPVYAQVPASPVNFYIVSGDQINQLYWTLNSPVDNVSQYNIYRSDDNVSYSLVGSTGINTYDDNALINGRQYYYKITAVNTNGESLTSFVDVGVPENDLGRFASFRSLITGSPATSLADSMSIPGSDHLRLTNQSFTVEFWMRPRSLPFPANEGYILSRYTTGGILTYAIFLQGTAAGSRLEVRTTNLTTGYYTTGFFQPNQWYHIAITFSFNTTPATHTAAIYVNGTISPSVRVNANLYSPANSVAGKMIIGSDNTKNPAQSLDGYLDELRIWNYVRTQPEIATNMCLRARGDEAGLLGLWHFDEPDLSKIPQYYDSSPYGKNGGGSLKPASFKPVALDDFIVTNENTATMLRVQANDTSHSGTKILTNSLLNGSAVILNSDSISYTPVPGFYGTDTIEYVLADTASYCSSPVLYDTAKVFVHILCTEKDSLLWAGKLENENIADKQYRSAGMTASFSISDPSAVVQNVEVATVFKNKKMIFWEQNLAGNIQQSSMKVIFNRPLSQLRFQLIDIDRSGGAYTDSVIVNAYYNGVKLMLTSMNITKGIGVDFRGNNSFRGNMVVDDVTGTEGDVSISYFTELDSIEIIFATAGDSPIDPAIQSIGMGDFVWCELSNDPPVIMDAQGIAVVNLSYLTPVNTPLSFCLKTSDINQDSVQLTAVNRISAGNNGTLTILSDSCVLYTPNPDFVGLESFTARVCDDRSPSLCTDVTITIEVTQGEVDRSFFISEVVSPNGDNILDYWVLKGIENYPNNTVSIYNIWGDLIFEQKKYRNDENGWRGETNARDGVGKGMVPDGTYYYMIDLKDGSPLYKGYLMLKRN